MNSRSMTVLILMASAVMAQTRDTRVQAPRFWNDRELADWALPVAGLNVRPAHFSEADYYAAPDAEWVRSYPVYILEKKRSREVPARDWRSRGVASGVVLRFLALYSAQAII